MGKLTDILQKAGRSANVAIGFRGAAAGGSKLKAAAIMVTVTSGSDAIAAAIKAGADAIIVENEAVTEAAKEAGVSWGIDARGAQKLTADDLKGLHERGADFVLLATTTSMRALGEPIEQMERVLVVPPPTDDPMLLGLRALNLVNVDAAVLDLQLSAQELAGLTVAQFAQLRMQCENLRFPVILTLRDIPAKEDMHTLARLGAAAIWLTAATPATITQLREELERVPREKEGLPGLGGLMNGKAAGDPLRKDG